MSLPAIAPLTAPAALDVADPLTDQAARWADHVLRTAPHLPPAGACPELCRRITRKALDAVAFSLRHGLHDLSVPSKLVGVARHQPAVEALVRAHDLPLALRPRLVVSVTRDAPGGPERLVVSVPRPDLTLARLGHVQPKHAAWLTPLLGTDGGTRASASLHLIEVTGLGRRAEGRPVTLGVNVRMTGIASIGVRAVPGGGGGERPAVLAVRLWRDPDGTARMTCPHVARHSPTGPEWGFQGSGPADCARSVLLALTDEVTAEAHYHAFAEEVIAALPGHGAIIQRTAVLAWLAGQATPALRPAA